MEVLDSLEAEGLGFREAIEVVARGLAAGVLVRHEDGIAAATSTADRRPNRILLVDDEDALRTALAELLREAGYDVVEAADGFQAMDRLREAPMPSLVLLDLLIPGPTGWDVLAWMRSMPALASLPVRVLTGMGAEIRVEGAKVLGKPLSLTELFAEVAKHCAS
jgi:CheY-like chemotaxis protein